MTDSTVDALKNMNEFKDKHKRMQLMADIFDASKDTEENESTEVEPDKCGCGGCNDCHYNEAISYFNYNDEAP